MEVIGISRDIYSTGLDKKNGQGRFFGYREETK